MPKYWQGFKAVPSEFPASRAFSLQARRLLRRYGGMREGHLQPSRLTCAVLVRDGGNHEAVKDIESRIALSRARIESGRGRHNKIEVGNDKYALTTKANRGDPSDFLF